MGRKLKCTVEEKITAVEDYLQGVRSSTQICNDLVISRLTLLIWRDKYLGLYI